MAYHFDQYDNSIVIDGFEKGIADSPYAGISDMRNVNIISVPGEASVNFSTSKISAPPLAGSLTTTSASADTITLTGGNLDIGQAIFFTGLSNTGAGLSNSTPYWVKSGSSGVYTLQASRATGSATVNITADSITGSWQTYNMASPKFFTRDNVNVAGTNQQYWMLDSSGQLWSNIIVTTQNSYWTYMGNYGGGTSNNTLGMNGNGLVYYQGSDGTGWIFVFRNSAIDYTPALASAISWTYGWKPADASTGNAPGYLNTSGTTSNSHETLVYPDNAVYYCDANYIGRWYQKDVTTPTAFSPTTLSTYTWDVTPVLPYNDIAQCLSPLGNSLLIGGQKNVIYPWDRVNTYYTQAILIAENYIAKMLTINTNTFILAGNRGRIYITNGSQAQLYKKIPDHLSGTVEPYFKWGGIASTKNQLYIGAVGTTNAGTNLNVYGGLWAIDMDTQAIRLTNQLSYGSYVGYASAIIPIINTPGTNNPGGTGLFIGWDTQTTTRGASDGVLNGSTTITSATLNFTANDVGSTIAGTGIPTGAVITAVNSATSITINTPATSTATGVSLTISSGFGIDQTSGNPYTGSQAYIDSDLIPIGTFNKTRNFERIEYRLSKPLVSGESVSLYYRLDFSQSYTLIATDSTVGAYSFSKQVNFKNAQWLQLRAVLNSTATTPSYTRIREFRITGMQGQGPLQQINL